jgi:hypothetical protein
MRGSITGYSLAAGLAVLSTSVPARADDDGHWHSHRGGWGIGFYTPPPVYYAPPPVYYAPPPRVYYAPPPPVYYAPPPVYPAPGLSVGLTIPFH